MSDALHARLDAHDARFDRLEKHVDRLDEDIGEIREKLGEVATKDDLHHAVNGILRDAINSVPAKQMVIWTAATALIAAAGVVVSLLMHGH